MAYMVFIFSLSSVAKTPALPGQSDKMLHGVLYAGLAVLVTRAIAGGWSAPMSAATVVLTVAVCGLYGVSDEYHQSFVPPRQPDARDVVADTIGATTGALACLVWSRWRGEVEPSGPV